MLRFLLRRLLQSIIVLFAFLTFVFFFTQLIMPGDYAIITRYGQGVSEVEELREELGLNRPPWQRYLEWVGGIFRGDLGRTFIRSPGTVYGEDGREAVSYLVVGRALQFTFLVLFTGATIAFQLGRQLGKALAWQTSRMLSTIMTAIAIVCYTTFPPLLVFLFVQLNRPINFFYPYRAFTRPIWPMQGDWMSPMGPIGIVCFYMFATLVATVLLMVAMNWAFGHLFRRRLPSLVYIILGAGIWVGGWMASGYSPWVLDIARVLSLSIVVIVILTFGETMLIMRTSMMDTLHEPYILTARAKGLPEHLVRDKHAARNAILPVLSRFIINFSYILAGMVMVEDAARLPTVGMYLFYSLDTRDVYTFMGSLLVIGGIALTTRLILDVMLAYLDPRIRIPTPQMRNPRMVAERRQAVSLRALLRELSSWQKKSMQQPPQPTTAGGVIARGSRALSEHFVGWRHWLGQRIPLFWKQIKTSGQVFAENRLAVFGVALIGLFTIMAITHPILMGSIWSGRVYDPNTGHDPMVFPHPSPPSLASGHLLGTDSLGRDVLSMLLASAPATFVVALSAAITAATVGTLIGAISAYYQGGLFDTVFGYVADVFLAIPIPVIMVVIGARYFNAVGELEFGLLYGLMAGVSNVAIMMRSQALKLMAQPFIEASRVAGAGAFRIIRVHIIPHMLPLAAVQMMLTVSSSVIAYAFIAFTAVAEFKLNWGAMIYFALTMTQTITGTIPWHVLIPPAISLALFAAAFYFVSRGLHEMAEPRLRRR